MTTSYVTRHNKKTMCRQDRGGRTNLILIVLMQNAELNKY